MAQIAVIGTSPNPGPLTGRSRLELFQATGGNTGNLAFAAAVHDQIVGSKTYYDWDFDPDLLNVRHERALLVCANIINPEIDLSELAWRIEKLRIPFCAFSLGVQAPLLQPVPSLSSGSDRCLRAISDRAVSIGLRGSLSADFLSRMGIRNWRIVGCPSNFLNVSTNFDERDWWGVAARVDQPIALHVEKAGDFAIYVAQFRRLVGNSRRFFFFQTAAGLTKAYCDGVPGDGVPGDLRPNELAKMEVYGAVGEAAARRMMETDFCCFFSMREWIQSSAELRFSIGARLHGNIVALQCGVPSLVVIHDERTRELADCLRLPGLTLAEFFRLGSLEEAIDAALAGVEHYVSRRRELGREFLALLDENGLIPSPELRSICPLPAPDGWENGYEPSNA